MLDGLNACVAAAPSTASIITKTLTIMRAARTDSRVKEVERMAG
jgi:hypothetical protein